MGGNRDAFVRTVTDGPLWGKGIAAAEWSERCRVLYRWSVDQQRYDCRKCWHNVSTVGFSLNEPAARVLVEWVCRSSKRSAANGR